MSTPKDGGPAFPVDSSGISGMSLRDWFAGQALAGIMANPDISSNLRLSGSEFRLMVVRAAFDTADVALAERAKK